MDRSALGRRSRTKGKKFELVARDHIKLAVRHLPWYASLVIRRSSQAERAWDADLIVEDGSGQVPTWLTACWIECEHSGAPDPRAKFAQATRDAAAASARSGRVRLPLVVWRRNGSRTLHASTDVPTLLVLMDLAAGMRAPVATEHRAETPGRGALLTMTLPDLLALLAPPA